jgi:serine/threonine protein kinase
MGQMDSGRVVGPGDEIRGSRRYVLERLLGEGAFAAVYEARCLEPGQACPPKVAVKVLCGDAGPQVINLLKREISSLLALDSRNIPHVHDWGQVHGAPFVVMDLYSWGSLQDQIRSAGPVDMATAWRLLRDLLSAICEAHRRSLLHLDIKPANVLLDGRGGFVLTDFGISQALKIAEGPALTPSAGTPAYRAPEQANLDILKFDARTDLYGVGLTVYHAATATDLSPKARGGKDLPPLRSVRPDADEELSQILARLTAADRSLRPGGAAEVLVRVDAKLSGRRLQDRVPGRFLSEEEIEEVRRFIVDPLLDELCARSDARLFYVCFDDNEVLCRQGEMSHHTFLLIHGTVQVERNGKVIGREARQGSFIGEVAALTGTWRTATVRARGPVHTVVFNAAELEDFLVASPAFNLRLVKTLSLRLLEESQQKKS